MPFYDDSYDTQSDEEFDADVEQMLQELWVPVPEFAIFADLAHLTMEDRP